MNTTPKSACPAPLLEEIRRESWYHTITLPDGSATDGVFDTRAIARVIPWPSWVKGGRCLDVGTCDGFWAFDMERQGAAGVVAIDVGHANDVDLAWEARQRAAATPRTPGATRAGHRFSLARQALGSLVERLECSVYDLDPAIHGKFDVVFCGTLLIHLQDPIRALERMRAVCAGELVLVECVDAFLDLVGHRVPSARLAPAPGQWWRSNTAGLIGMLRIAGFDVLSVSRPFVTPFGAGVTKRGKGWRRPLATATASLNRWPVLARAPGLVQAVGLLGGTYDIAIRARPQLQSRDQAHPVPSLPEKLGACAAGKRLLATAILRSAHDSALRYGIDSDEGISMQLFH